MGTSVSYKATLVSIVFSDWNLMFIIRIQTVSYLLDQMNYAMFKHRNNSKDSIMNNNNIIHF